ncbi:MAG: YcxB family protein [bacterium]|nr:YcxB family protein [bacterium]
MKIAYETTVDEVTEAIVRHHEISGLITRRKWQALALFIVYFILYWLLVVQKAPTTINLWSSILAAVIGYAVFLAIIKTLVRMSVRRFVVKTHGTREPVPAEYELDKNGIAFRKQGKELRFSWDSVVAVNETDKSIELIIEPMAIVVIYKRGLNGPDRLSTLITFIEEHTKPGIEIQPFNGPGD